MTTTTKKTRSKKASSKRETAAAKASSVPTNDELTAAFQKEFAALDIVGHDTLPEGKRFALFLKTVMNTVYKARRGVPNARTLANAGTLCNGMNLIERCHAALGGAGIARTFHASFTYTPAKSDKQVKTGTNRHIDYWNDLLFQRTPTLSETLDPERMTIHTG